MKIIYSFNKTGYESEYWQREISIASFEGCTFIVSVARTMAATLPGAIRSRCGGRGRSHSGAERP